MSTNYYANKVICVHCGNSESIHLGKKGFGWEFSFQGSDTIRTFVDWLALVLNADDITNSYGDRISVVDMVEIATVQHSNQRYDLHESSPYVNSWRDEGYYFLGNEFS